MTAPFFLARLGLDTKADERDVKRAYARELKQIDQEQDPTGFQQLRECYERAQTWLRYRDDEQEEDDILAPAEEPVPGGEVPPIPPTMAAQMEDVPAGDILPSEEPMARQDGTHFETPADLLLQHEERAGQTAEPSLHLAEPLMSDAQLVLADFLPRMYASAQSSSKPTLESVREGLKRCLADPRMISLDAGDEFERAIAHILVQGWKPGHETLFVAALLEFDWEQDIRRLQRLDFAGGFLAHAIAERQHFFQQEHYSMEAQRRVIDMLRKDERPSDADVVKYAPLVEGMLQRYPHVIAVIVGHERAEQWLRWLVEVPQALRDKIMPIKMQQPVAASSGGRRSYWWVGPAIFGIFKLLQLFSGNH